MSKEYTVKEAGYAYVYISNETLTLVDVYFDDVTMTYTPTNILQVNEYYPYGLQTASSWTREGNSNNFLYNSGTEQNTTTGLYDLAYRNFDPALGRFHQVDPLADAYGSSSPFGYGNGNPVSNNDPLGLQSSDGVNEGGGCNACLFPRSFKDSNYMGDPGRGGGAVYSPQMTALSHTSWQPIVNFIGQALYGSSRGGSWNNGVITMFTNDAEAFASGMEYNEANGSFDYTTGGSWSGNAARFAKATGIVMLQGVEIIKNYSGFGGEPYDDPNWLWNRLNNTIGRIESQIRYSKNFDTSLSVAGNVLGAFESGAAIGTLQQVSKMPYGAIKGGLKMTKGLGTAGFILAAAVAAHEFATKHDNTHTWVDLGVTAVGLGLGMAFGSAALPAIAVGGLIYGVWSYAGGSDWIDERWGYRDTKTFQLK